MKKFFGLVVLSFLLSSVTFVGAELLPEEKIINAESVSKTLKFAIKEHERYLKYLEQEISSIKERIKNISEEKLLSKFKVATKNLENVVKITIREIERKRKTINNNFILIEDEMAVIALAKTPHFKKPDHAFFDITLKELLEDQEFYSSKNVAVSGWLRKQLDPKGSHYSFFLFGLNDDEITVIFDVNKTIFNASIIDQPFYIMGEFVTEISIETDIGDVVELKSALLVSHISKNWEMLK